MAYGHTYGLKLEIYDTAATPPAYIVVGGVQSITPPSISAGDPIEVTNHTSPGGFREHIHSPLYELTEVTGNMYTDIADAGQNLLRASVGSTQRFKVTLPSRPGQDVEFNAVVSTITNGTFEMESVDNQDFTLKPTGQPI